MNRYKIRQSKRGKWFVELQVGDRKFLQTLQFFTTREEAEALAQAVAGGQWMDASLTYGGGDA